MKDADKSRSKVFGFIHFRKHAKDNVSDRRKQKIEKFAITKKENTQLFRDCENTVSVNAGNKYRGHMKRTHLVVFVATGGTESAFATEGNEFKVSAMSTGIHGTTVRRVTTMNHLVDILDDGRTRM